jgi:outer membrane protein assembly factor BamB
MNSRARRCIPPDTGGARVHPPAVRGHISTRLALVASLLLALLLTACDSSLAPVLKTPTATASLARENLYAACGDGIIHVLQARDGAVVERLYKLGGPSASALALSAGVLYYGEFNGRGNPSDTALVARDTTTGRELWRTATQGNVVAPPVIQQDTVYVAVYVAPKHLGDNPVSALLALDARSGAIRWRYESREVIVGSPTVNGDTMWATASSWTTPPRDSSRSLLALRAHDGTLLWRVPLADIPSSSPVLAQGILYVGSWLGALYARTRERLCGSIIRPSQAR